MSEQPISEEWDDPITDEERDDMLRSLKAFKECDHEWRAPNDSDGLMVMAEEMPELQVCDKCGGAQLPMSEEAFTAFSHLMEGQNADEES